MTHPADIHGSLIVPRRPPHRGHAAAVALASLTVGLGLGGAVGMLGRPRAETFTTGPCPHGGGVSLDLRIGGGTIACIRCGQPIARQDLEQLRARAAALETFLRACSGSTTTTTETTR
jgi:hypothetical protein